MARVLEGRDDISPEAALSLSLLLHELTTNALKYGALSVPSGRVVVCWHIEEKEAAMLVLHWSEEGGPAVRAPTSRQGFGSKLIRVGLLGTRAADLRYEPAGLQAAFRADGRRPSALRHDGRKQRSRPETGPRC